MSDQQPDPEAWRAYGRKVVETIRGLRANSLTMERCRSQLYAKPDHVSDDIPIDILNLIYEEPGMGDADPDFVGRIVERLEAGATHAEIVAYLEQIRDY
jgi:hypothetical protein